MRSHPDDSKIPPPDDPNTRLDAPSGDDSRSAASDEEGSSEVLSDAPAGEVHRARRAAGKNPHEPKTLIDDPGVDLLRETADLADMAREDLHHPAPSEPVSVEDFVQSLSESGLMARAEFQAFLASLSEDHRPRCAEQVADLLVEHEKLTAYQAGVLRRGRTTGLVLGNYEILEKLGEGGMGLVFKARHRRMKRTVALKILPRAIGKSPEALGRFQREMEAAAKFQHVNLASAFDADEAEGVHFLVLEYVDGPNLSSYVKKAGPLPLGTAVYLILQAARGLAHAHAKGVVHRDIKPSNLMVNRQGVVKVLDMGLAQLTTHATEDERTELTRSGRVMGTVDYMAPEQAQNPKTVDGRADIYSLGCSLYFLLSGRPPAPEGALAQKLLWHQSQPAPSLWAMCPEAPESLERLFQKMMAKSPDERQSSMQEVIDELTGCLDELSSQSFELGMLGIQLTAGQPVTEHGLALNGATVVEEPASDSGSSAAWPTRPRKPGRTLAACATAAVALALIGSIGSLLFRVGPWWSRAPVTRPPENHAAVDPGHSPNPTPSNKNADQGEAKENSGQLAAGLRRHAALLERVFSLDGAVTLRDERGDSNSARSRAEIPRSATLLWGVDLSGADISEEDVRMLATAPELTSLDLSQTAIDDDSLKSVAALDALEILSLAETSVGNQGLQHLGRLSRLRDLNLRKTAVTDQGLAWLFGLSRLETLDLSDNAVSDDGVATLARFPWLKQVKLYGAWASQAGVRQARQSNTNLEVLWDGPDLERAAALALLKTGAVLTLASAQDDVRIDVDKPSLFPRGRFTIVRVETTNPDFGDQDLKRLGQLTGIRELSLANARVTDEGLQSLSALTSLRSLDLGAISVSNASLRALRDSLVDCDIQHRDPPDREAAKWTLAAGGRVLVSLNGQPPRELKKWDEAPDQLFFVTAIDLTGSAELGGLEPLAGLRRLEALLLSGARINNQDLQHLADCRALRRLDLARTEVGGKGLASLSSLPALQRLDLTQTQVDQAALRALAGSASLQQLTLADCDIQSGDLRALPGFPSLTDLSLDGAPIDDQALETLTSLSGLRRLSVKRTKLSDEALERLSAVFPPEVLQHDPLDAQRLAAKWVLSLDGGVVQLASGPLTTVDQLPADDCQVRGILLRRCPVSNAQFSQHVGQCAGLRSLDLLKVEVVDGTGDDLLETVGGCGELQRLVIQSTRVSDQGLRHLEKLTKLATVELSGCRVSGQGLARLGGNHSLVSLRLSNNRDYFDDQGLLQVFQFPSLEELYIDGNTRISQRPLLSLRRLPRLRKLGLRDTGFSDQTLPILAELRNLESLDISNTKVTDAGAEAFKKLKSLRSLKLYRTQIGDSTLQALQELKQLRELDVSRTRVTKAGVASLQRALPNCVVLDPATEFSPVEDPPALFPFELRPSRN